MISILIVIVYLNKHHLLECSYICCGAVGGGGRSIGLL